MSEAHDGAAAREDVCARCRFYWPGTARETPECRRRAPDHAGFARTAAMNWCGEYTPRLSAACRSGLAAAFGRAERDSVRASRALIERAHAWIASHGPPSIAADLRAILAAPQGRARPLIEEDTP
jgi:hypothetical protein